MSKFPYSYYYFTIGHLISECNSIFRNVGMKRLFTLSWLRARIFRRETFLTSFLHSLYRESIFLSKIRSYANM